MSQQNVEAFWRAVVARNRRDTDALIDEFHPEVELHPGMAAQLRGRGIVYRGHAGLRDWLRDLDEAFADLPAEFSDVRDLGETVVAIGRVRGHGQDSGAAVEWPLAYIVEFEHGKMTRVRTYLDHDEALEAAGLSE